MKHVNKRGVEYDPSSGRIKPFWTKERKEKATKLYKNGKSLRQVATAMKCGLSCVQSLINDLGIMRKKSTTRLNLEKHRLWIVKNYVNGDATIFDICSRVKCDTTTVYDWLKDNKLYVNKYVAGAAKRATATSNAALYYWLDDNIKDYSLPEYDYAIRRIAEIIYNRHQKIIDPKRKRGKGAGKHHADHKLSIFDGYFDWSIKRKSYVRRKSLVPLRVICHPVNIQMISGTDNCRKNARSHVTECQLLEDIKLWNAKYGDPFKPLTER